MSKAPQRCVSSALVGAEWHPVSISVGLTQLGHSASECHAFACPSTALRTSGSMVRAIFFVCGFSARSAEKPHTIEKECTALPKAHYAICVSLKVYRCDETS